MPAAHADVLTPVDPADILVLVRCYPDEMMMPQILAWTHRHGIPDANIRWYNKRFITAATNTAIRDIALPSKAKRFLFLDADIRPDRRTDPVLTTPGDVVGCMFPVPDMSIWRDPDVVHGGLMRVDRPVMEKMKAPWFARVFTDDGCDVKLCPCQWFSDQARAAGFSVTRAGWADHRIEGDASRRGD